MKSTQLQARLPLLPEGAQVVSPRLAVVRENGMFVLFNAAGPIYECKEDDTLGLRQGVTVAASLELATVTALAKAAGVHRATLHRSHAKFAEGGAKALQPQKRGPKGPHKLTPAVLRQAQRALDEGASLRDAGRRVGVSHFAIGHAIKKGLLTRLSAETSSSSGPVAELDESLARPRDRAAEDQSCEAGVAVKRTDERALARAGKLIEAAPQCKSAEAVPGAGALLALPALIEEGLLDVGQAVYGDLRNGFFGLRSILLTFAFLALLRIKTPEQLKGHAPGELGLLLGLDRAPEVKTLRRKLRELGAQGRAHALAEAFARRWASEEPEALGYLYVDGHVRPYHGRKHALPKTHVQRRRLCMPATSDFWVNDERAEPLFFVTAEANDGLLSMLEREVLPTVRELIGEGRRVTILFDREAWSPKSFARWAGMDFDVITYRKGRYEPWEEEVFIEVEDTTERPPVRYRLAEQETTLAKGFAMREVRRLCDDGHQTSIMTTRRDLAMLEVATRMFARWRQENFFRYMRHEYELDHLCTYEVEPAAVQRLVVNLERKALDKELAGLRRELEGLKRDYAQAVLDNPERQRRTVRGFKIANAEFGKRIRGLEGAIGERTAQRNALPKKVPIGDVRTADQIVRLELERKTLTDLIKMVAYRTESSMLRLIGPLLARHEEEGRAFLKALFQAPADLIPHENGRQLTVRFHSMAHRRFNNVLRAVCEALTSERHCYPGTRLRMVFEGPDTRIRI